MLAMPRSVDNEPQSCQPLSVWLAVEHAGGLLLVITPEARTEFVA